MKNVILNQVIMLSKWSFYGLIAQLIFVGVLLADDSQAQSVKNVRDNLIQIELNNSSLTEIFSLIESQTDYHFAYDSKAINENLKFSRKYDDMVSVSEVLLDVSEVADLKFKQVNKNIIVSRKPFKEVDTRKSKPESIAQTIEGIVTSAEDGTALPGVNVVIKGTNTGTITDIDGKYIIDVENSTDVLVFSSVGYETQEIVVGNRSVIDIILNQDVQALEEIVVIGYGEVNKRDLTGSVGSIESELINELPVAGFDQAMQGKLSGVRVINANAAPGGGFDIQVRGIGSLTSSTYPLIVVDGMPLQDENYQAENNPFNLINPNDIESIEVLKDASSAAIYGARAGNGVILITTKRGNKARPVLNFNASYGVSQMINMPEYTNAEQYKQYWMDTRNYTYWKHSPGHYNPDDETEFKYGLDSEADYLERRRNVMDYNLLRRSYTTRPFYFLAWDTVNTNIHDEFFRSLVDEIYYQDGEGPWSVGDQNWMDAITGGGTWPGSNQNYSLSASGGTDRARYFVSGSYYKDDGVVQKTDYERFTVNLNLDFKVTDHVTVGAKLMPSWQDLNNLGGDRIEARWFASPFYGVALQIPPILNAYDEDGIPIDYSRQSEFQTVYRTWGTEFFGNPVYQFEGTDNRKTFRALTNLWAEVNFLKNFKFRSAFLTDYVSGKENQHRPSTQGDRFLSPGPQLLANASASSRQDRKTKWYWENILSYTKTFNEDHNVDIVIGYTAEKTENSFVYLEKYNFVSDEIGLPSQGSEIRDPLEDATDGLSQNSFIGILGRAQYNFRQKYYLTASFRRDGSSRFGSETLWGNFPSAAIAWRLSEESFMQNLGWLDDLKIRASYGETGNSSIPSYRQQRIINFTPYVINNAYAQGFEDARLYDPALGWEKTVEYNLGLDMAFMEGRLGFSTEAYRRTTTDMLLSVDMPQYSGYSSILQNFGEMENRGVEVTLHAVPVVRGGFSWNLDFNITHNQGKITKLFPNENQFISGNSAAGGLNFTRSYVGGPISLFWGQVYKGVFRDWNEVYTEPSIFNYSGNNIWNMQYNSTQPGELKTADVNGDGILDGKDDTVIGNPWPDFFWGFSNVFKYKGFDLYIQMDGTVGAEVFNALRFQHFRQAQRGFSMPLDYFNDYWTPDNPDAKWPGLARDRQRNAGWQNSAMVEDGDFTAIRTVRLGYTFPGTLAQKILLTKIRLYLNVQNAFFFTNYTGFNPEGNNLGREDISRTRNFGLDAGNYPISRTVTFGIDVNF